MIPEKLKHTDECLIKLLHERMSILAESGMPTVEEQIESVAPLLAQLGIPETVWANHVVNICNTVLATKSLAVNPVNSVKSQQITLIGGRGRMGKFFTEQLTAAGHKVTILGREDWEYADQLLGEADLVLVSVPIEQTVDVIKRAAKYLSPTTALADITSIKAQPVQAMLEHHSGPVMGLHPMFGPSVQSFSEQKVVVTSGRNDEYFQWLLDFMESKGAKLVVCTPEEHDRIMEIVQAIRHFSRFSFGVFLAKEGIDIDQSLLMSSPSYRLEIDIVNRLFAQSPSLCVDIMLATAERCQTIERLANIYSRLAQLVAEKDRASLIQEFETTQCFFADNSIRSASNQDYAIAANSS